MRFRIQRINGDRFAIPMCQNSERACLLAKSKYLTSDQVKLLQLMGFSIKEEDLEKEDVKPFYIQRRDHD